MRAVQILVRSGQQLLLVLWTILAIAPFVLIMLLGFRDNTGIYANPFGIGGTYHPENFAAVVASDQQIQLRSVSFQWFCQQIVDRPTRKDAPLDFDHLDGFNGKD